MDDIIHNAQSGDHPAGLNGFTSNIRSLFVATFCALILYLLLLLIKFFINALYGSRNPAGRNYTKGGGGFDGFRSRNKSRVPPPPPAMAPMTGGGGAAGAGGTASGMEQGLGGGGPGGGGYYGPYTENDMSQGIESEKGYPGEPETSQRLSRAADVFRLGFLILLGGTALNALSFDAGGDANALGWITFALICIWAILAFFSRSKWIPLLMGIPTFAVGFALYSVGFLVHGFNQ